MEFLLLTFQGTDPSVRFFFFFFIIMPGLLGFHILPFFLELENVESGVAKLFNYYYTVLWLYLAQCTWHSSFFQCFEYFASP